MLYFPPSLTQGDTLQHMQSGATMIVFLTRGPLVLVAASSGLGEPIHALQVQGGGGKGGGAYQGGQGRSCGCRKGEQRPQGQLKLFYPKGSLNARRIDPPSSLPPCAEAVGAHVPPNPACSHDGWVGA